MIAACDIGLIFLDHRFTVPNFPSRLLNYMQAGIPVLACTDTITDVGKVIVENEFGWWCESNDAEKWAHKVNEILRLEQTASDTIKRMGQNGKDALGRLYRTQDAWDTIVRSMVR
jgi:glycosyltransferase involved in cell wall biosynthesis